MFDIKVWTKCKHCNKYKSEVVSHGIGDNVKFTSEIRTGRTVRFKEQSGKIAGVSENGNAIVKYGRGKQTVKHVCSLSSSKGCNEITVALLGECKCNIK